MNEEILLVDDNAAFIDSIKDILEDEGYRVTIAHSGEDAVRLTQKDSFALVLMDIKMPGMNGVECFLKMKSHNPEVRVILFTAYALQDLIQKAENNGVWAVLKKPLDMQTLITTIRDAKKNASGGCILVADDDQALCDNLLEILTLDGYRVAVACDGQVAVSMIEERPYDLLLLDLKLPKLNGLEVYRKIKALRPNLITILMTGYASELQDLIGQAISESAYTLLTKPLDMEQLLKLMATARRDRQNGIVRKPAPEGV